MPESLPAALVEFNENHDVIILEFQYTPESLERTRAVDVQFNNVPGMGTDFAFSRPSETPRLMQSASLQPETLSVETLFSAADYMDREDFNVSQLGIQPVLDCLRLLVTPRLQRSGGLRLLTELGLTSTRAFERDMTPSVCLFIWGEEVLPVVLTSVSYTIEQMLPNLRPIHASVRLSMQLIEVSNPFSFAESLRQITSAEYMQHKPGLLKATDYY